jgi:3-carboxy-cis,cis-muconate cycloisomerase
VTLVLSSNIFGAAFVDRRAAELLSDEALFRTLLEVEVALARVQGRLGVIPTQAAAAIEAAAATLPLDAGALTAGVLKEGVPIVALVSQLRAALPAEAAPFVHLGATSQDIVDTATVLMARRVIGVIDADLIELMRRLVALARVHRSSVMAARTHSQQALPTSFGLKLASWALPFARHRQRLRELSPRLAVVQLGGAAGTMLAFGPRGLEQAEALGRELGLGLSELPWHTQRDAIAELGSWLGLCSGSLGKLAQDVILLCQTEVMELREAPHGTRGGSSSMPQKNNPMRSEQILAAARGVAAQLSALMGALVQEHERGTHGWQVEWLCLTPMLMLTAGAFRNALELTRDLVVHPERMRANLTSQHGLVLAEAVVNALSEAGGGTLVSRTEARNLVTECAARAVAEGTPLVDLVAQRVDAAHPQHGIDWVALARPENHLGQAQALIDRALARIEREL